MAYREWARRLGDPAFLSLNACVAFEASVLAPTIRALNFPAKHFRLFLPIIVLFASRVWAAPVDPNNILVSVGNSLAGTFVQYNSVYEFTPTGTLVQTIPFNYNGSTYPGSEYLRDIIVAPDGLIYGYNGTFSPFLSGYSPILNTFTHTTFPGWSCVNGVSNGGIGAFQNYVYVTDMNTNGAAANGIVRFDILNNSAVRFGDGISFTDLSVGLDGKVYGLYVGMGGSKLNVYDPIKMALLGTVTLQIGGAVAIDQFGQIFVAAGHVIYRLNSSGMVEASGDTGIFGGGFTDIDVNLAGGLVMTMGDSHVVIGNTSLGSFSSFIAINDPQASNWTVFASFASPVPEPSALSLLLAGSAIALLMRLRHWSALSYQKSAPDLRIHRGDIGDRIA